MDIDSKIYSPSKKRQYTEEEDKCILEYITSHHDSNTPLRKTLKALVEEKKICRSFESVFERTREVLVPEVKLGIRKHCDFPKSVLATKYTPKSQRRKVDKRGNRVPVTKEDTLEVARVLLLCEERPHPNSTLFWQGKKDEINLDDKHPARLISIFRNHIDGKEDTLDISQEERCLLKSKLLQTTRAKNPAEKKSNNTELKTSKKRLTKAHHSNKVSQQEAVASCEKNKGNSEGNMESTAVEIANMVYSISTQGQGEAKLACTLVVQQIRRLKRIADAVNDNN